MGEPSRIEIDQFLPHPPARVWRALTDSRLLAQWLMPNDFQPRVGHRFTLDTGPWGETRCEVLAIEDEHLLRIAWENPPLDTTVTWRIEAEGSGTRLFVIHDGFDPDDPAQRSALRGMAQGWRSEILGALRASLDELAATER